MSNKSIIIESDSESITSSSSKRGTKSGSHSLSFVSGDFKLDIVSLVDDSKIEGCLEILFQT